MIRWVLMLTGWIVADVLWWRVVDRKLQQMNAAKPWRWTLGGFITLMAAYVMTVLIGSIAEHVPEVQPIYWPVCAYVWHLFLMPASILVYVLSRGIGWLRNKRPVIVDQLIEQPKPAPRMTRREALAALGVALPPIITAGIGVVGAQGLGNFKVREVTLKLAALPPDLDGLTIAHVSDLHIGRFLPAGTMERVAEATNAMQAELVLFTGDLVDASCETTAGALDFMRRLDRRSGLAMIEGNHDGMRGADWFEGDMKNAGLPLLLDEMKVFNVAGRPTPVQIMGIQWGERVLGSEIGQIGKAAKRWYRKPSDQATADSVKRVAAQRTPGAFPILLAHHPHAFDPATAAGLPLVLSGHTHGGQIMLTKNIGAGPLRFKYWAGEYQKQDAKLFVNSGVGNWFPLRVNAPAEIVKLTLRRV